MTTNADAHADSLAPVVRALQEAGYTSLRALACELNARSMRTRRSGRRQVSKVRNLLERINPAREARPD